MVAAKVKSMTSEPEIVIVSAPEPQPEATPTAKPASKLVVAVYLVGRDAPLDIPAYSNEGALSLMAAIDEQRGRSIDFYIEGHSVKLNVAQYVFMRVETR